MFKKLLFLTILGVIIFTPLVPVLAEASEATVVKLENPLGAGRLDLRVILGEIIGKVMGVAGSLILLVFIYGGFMWLTAAGNPEHVKKGTQAMLWAVVGLFIIFASYGMISLVFKAMGTKGTGYNPWGVEGVTKDDVVKAVGGCYCLETVAATGVISPAKVLQVGTEEKDCPVGGKSDSVTGLELSECKWETFTSETATST